WTSSSVFRARLKPRCRAEVESLGKMPRLRRTLGRIFAPPLSRQRIRSQLKVHHFPLGALAAFDMPDEVGAVVRPQPATLPTRARIVDPAIHPARIESERIRNAQRGPLFRLRV